MHEQCLRASLDKTLFIESWCDDERIIEENVLRVKISSPDVSTSPSPAALDVLNPTIDI